jgi:hypothetical protein
MTPVSFFFNTLLEKEATFFRGFKMAVDSDKAKKLLFGVFGSFRGNPCTKKEVRLSRDLHMLDGNLAAIGLREKQDSAVPPRGRSGNL